MKKLLTVSALSFFVLFAVVVHAGEFGDLKKKISDARESFVAMLKNPDKRGEDQQKLVKDTANAVSATIAGIKAPAGKEAQFKELADTWSAFKNTRETELVPMVLSGKQEDAEKLAGGIQKERLKKINEICDALGD
ncbi:MAG: hypothetical protein HZA01_02980 [Nitrospinae bacterium]|nr:hypothetical protein [Nitrospinota bacterium]